jgi:hypothetical protein
LSVPRHPARPPSLNGVLQPGDQALQEGRILPEHEGGTRKRREDEQSDHLLEHRKDKPDQDKGADA